MSSPAQPEAVLAAVPPVAVPISDGPMQVLAPVPYNPPAPASAPSASLYVGELDPTITEASLFEIFNMIGPVARCVTPTRMLSGLANCHLLASVYVAMLSLVAPWAMLTLTISTQVMV
jgi:hypothetical protein